MSKVNIEGMNKNDAITALINSGLDFKASNKYWVENRPERGSGFRARFYAELEKGEMNTVAFGKFIEKESANIVRNSKNFDAIREMANAIRKAK